MKGVFNSMSESITSGRDISQTSTELPEALQESTRPKNMLFLVLYAIANMVVGVGSITISTILLPIRIASLVAGNPTSTFSLVLGIGAVAAVIANPLIGTLSDRTTSRFGRRRPWLVAGGVLSVIAILLLSIASSLLAVMVEWVVLQIAMDMILVTLFSIIPDQIPLKQRATASAFAAGLGAGLGGLFGQTLVAQVFKGTQAAYISLAVTAAIMIALFLLVLREVPLPKAFVPPFRVKNALTMWKPLTQRDFALTWLARCLMNLGNITVLHFMFFYLQDAVHYPRLFPGQTTAQGVQIFSTIEVAALLAASVVGGLLSDRFQRRKVFVVVSSVIMTVSLLLYAFFPTWSLVLVATVAFGISTGIFISTDLALVSQVLPAAADRGKDMGIINTTIFIPILLSPAIAGITLSVWHSYFALFSLLAVATLLAAVCILPIKSVR